MLSTNVLCLKKKKKRSYCFTKKAENGIATKEKSKRSAGGAATMLQITEDTPPDMLAGAMDLTVHLPTGRAVKMSVERSTPMMDLLVQITTNYHLQLSGYTLQALGMAPSKEHSDSILPYKPNTPIGALDTQHIKVIPKARNTAVPKNVPPGHQPFESTFRLKVHLPRNQLFVTRVSQSVHLGDIMRKVCEEKNLDPLKYEFRHPGNLDEILDPKLSLSDYAITEIYLVQKGTGSLNQTFSTSDIMALRKEEERKQMHTKTGGGVFNLIFRRGKSSTGSLSSENRSISPTHSDDSRSVTPPSVQQPIITPPDPPPPERPKPPQRKRRPAPKPPTEAKKPDPGLTVCHSRNSSDSSGYHEASILSDNNTSLPRRPKSTIIGEEAQKSLSEQCSQSTSNLSKMAVHSKSTSSLAFASRKKKTAPPPPPVLKPEKNTNLEEPSPVVASQPCTVAQTDTSGNGRDVVVNTKPKPTPRIRTKTAPFLRPRSLYASNTEEKPEAVNDTRIKDTIKALNTEVKLNEEKHEMSTQTSVELRPDGQKNNQSEEIGNVVTPIDVVKGNEDYKEQNKDKKAIPKSPVVTKDVHNIVDKKREEIMPKEERHQIVKTPKDSDTKAAEATQEDKKNVVSSANNEDFDVSLKKKFSELAKLQKHVVTDLFEPSEKVKPPEVVALHPKPQPSPDHFSKSIFDSYTRKRGFQIGSSLLDLEDSAQSQKNSGLSTPNSVESALNAFEFVDEIEDLDVNMFTESLSKNSKNKNLILNQLHGMHDLDFKKNPSGGSLRSVSSFPGFAGGNMKKWSNVEELDDISLHSYGGRNGWVIGDTSDTESIASITTSHRAALESVHPVQQSLPLTIEAKEKPTESEKGKEEEKEVEEISETAAVHKAKQEPTVVPAAVPAPKNLQEIEPQKNNELESDWQYQLPSPPKAFRDSSPVVFADVRQESIADSVVTSPELFEKLKVVKDNQSEKETVSDLTSVVSEEERPILNKLSLENLEKRKSLVYNRELATSLKMPDDERKPETFSKTETFSSSLLNFEKTYDEVKQSSLKQSTSTLPNFKITTYNDPKQKIDIFEDDTIRSTDRATKRSSVEPTFPLQKGSVGRSMENISFRKNSLNSLGRSSDDEFPRNSEYKFYRPSGPKNLVNIFRSESFSKEQTWVPTKPVSRSKSQVAINTVHKYKESKSVAQEEGETLTKSNSLFDVSGLQSLGVMRLIQNKLNTPTTSTEHLDKEEPSYQKPPEIKHEVQNPVEEKPQVKVYKYTPPSVNMGTWSDRPKIPVNVKEDPDYKYSVRDRTSKLIVSTTNNDIKSQNSIEVRNKVNSTSFNSVSVRVSDNNNKNVSIKVNGFEPVSQSGNVVIKINGDNSSINNNNSNRAIFRKPLGNVNTDHQRPHSVAFGNDFDISRVPIVRSVEFKKPYKEYQKSPIINTGSNNNNNNNNNHNTSITQILPNNNFVSNTNRNGYKEPEAFKNPEPIPVKPLVESKPVFRVNSYLQNTSTPVVRGFRNNEVKSSQVTSNNRMSWGQPHSFSTLPAKPVTRNFALSAPVPFSQSNLRRAESTNLEKKSVPPPAPIMPKVFAPPPKREDFGDPKEQLLQAIRDFGGKKSLRAVKA